MKIPSGKYVRRDLTYRPAGIYYNGKFRDEDFHSKFFIVKICLTDIFR